jgi:hypothetical protein
MAVFNEQVAKPWAEEMARRFQALGDAWRQSALELRKKQCGCGCGHTLGEIMAEGSIVNPHGFRIAAVGLLGEGKQP